MTPIAEETLSTVLLSMNWRTIPGLDSDVYAIRIRCNRSQYYFLAILAEGNRHLLSRLLRSMPKLSKEFDTDFNVADGAGADGFTETQSMPFLIWHPKARLRRPSRQKPVLYRQD